MLAARLVLVGDDRPPRRDVDLPASLRTDSVPFDILIENLSAGGFRATLGADIAVESNVIVGTACFGMREARVVWRNGQQYGFEFVQPLRPVDVADAQAIDNVIALSGTATAPPVPAGPFPDPVVEKWPRAVRLIMLLVGLALSWALIVATARRLL